jgi:hypothetical protein
LAIFFIFPQQAVSANITKNSANAIIEL